MVTIDVPACIALGSAVALRHAPSLPERTSDLRVRTLLLATFGFAPLGQLFDLYFHDWEWQYFVTSSPPFVSVLFVAAMSAGGLLGFELTRTLILTNNRKAAWAVCLGCLGFSGLYSLIFYKRVFWVGSASEWASGTAPFMLTRVDFMALLGGCSALLAVGCYLWLLRPLPNAR